MIPQFDNTEIAFKYRTNKDLKRARFLFTSMSSPIVTQVGSTLAQWAIKWHLPVKGIIKKTIFEQFCGGETMGEAAATSAILGQYGVGVILDYSVEGKEGEAEFDNAVPEFIKAIEYAASQKNIPFISLKVTGFARFALLEKIHAASTLSSSESDEWQKVHSRIDKICTAAAKNNIMVLIDAEESWIQEAVNELCNTIMQKLNKGRIVVFNTFQLYCHASLEYLKTSLIHARENNYLLGAKLVRGAYMEKERARANEKGYPSPIQPDKASTDKDYDEAVQYCLEHLTELALFIGTHNEKSCMQAAEIMEKKHIPHNHPHVYFSQLYGMSDNISFNLAHEGYNVAKYLPYGPVKDVVPYLIRRAQENTSVAGQTGRELSLINKEIQRRKLK